MTILWNIKKEWRIKLQMHCLDVWLIEMLRLNATVVIPVCREAVKTFVINSSYFKQLKEKMCKGTDAASHYKKIDMWYYKDRIMLYSNSELCKRVFSEYHSIPSGGYSGYHHTLRRIKHTFGGLVEGLY